MKRGNLHCRAPMRSLALGLIVAIVGCSPSKQAQRRDRLVQPAKAEETSADQNFKEAISTLSTNTSFVLVAVTDTNTGKTKTGCTTANGLLGAIHRERNIGYDEDSLRTVTTIALTSPHQRFAFAKPDALENIGFNKINTQYPEECALLREGWTATRGDIGDELFTNKPGYKFKSQSN